MSPIVMKTSSLATLLIFVIAVATVSAQTPPEAPQPDRDSYGLGTDCAYENFFAGPSFTAGDSIGGPTFTGGVTIGQYFARTLGKGITPSPQFEFGIVGPLPGGKAIDGLASLDMMFANKVPNRSVYPFLTGGYTRMFATGNAVNFGPGVDFGKDDEHLIRIELRDYYLFTGPQQHVLSLRIGFGKFIAD